MFWLLIARSRKCKYNEKPFDTLKTIEDLNVSLIVIIIYHNIEVFILKHTDVMSQIAFIAIPSDFLLF